MSARVIAEQLRACITAGEFGPLAEAYAGDAVLDVSLPGSRRRLEGPAQAVAVLGACFPGPGRVVQWDAAVDPAGIAIWVERVDDRGAVRQRHYLHTEPAGQIARHWIYTARPHTAPPREPVPAAAEQLFAGLGEIAERITLASSGWSGNRIDRLAMADGRALIAKRIVPGSDWLGRATRDPGREALLFSDGVFARMPEVVDPTIVAAQRDGDAWWVVMRDVSGELLDDVTPLTREQNRFVLGCAAAMWADFWDEPVPHLSTLRDRLACAAPAVSERERDELDLLPKQFEAAWEAFDEAVDADLGTAVLELVHDVAPLAARP